MVEVFRTNVSIEQHASFLVHQIERQCRGALVSFDLADCDRVLRVEITTEGYDFNLVKEVIQRFGFEISALPDTVNL